MSSKANTGKASPPSMDLLEFCKTEFQENCIKAWNETGSARKAAKALGLGDHTQVVTATNRVRRHAAKAHGKLGEGMDMQDKMAAGFDLSNGYSLQTRTPDGDLIWLKAKPENDRKQAALEEFIEELKHQTPRREPIGKLKVSKLDDSILPCIFIGDSHYGMYASSTETRHSSYNSDIASELMLAAIEDLIERAPPAETIVICDVGDYTHSNSSHNQTFSGTPVDVDTRLSRVLRVASRAMKTAVELALTKYAKVVLVVARGNHNPDMALAVQGICEAWFENEPRVDVLQTDGFFHYIEYGNWLLGINHGDKVKPDRLPGIMARDMAKAWGRTTSRMWCLGHFHHDNVKEFDGCTVRRFAALPPPDAWHAQMGFSSIQAMHMMILRKTGGLHSQIIHEIQRPQMEPDRRIE